MNFEIYPEKIDFIYDELDTNAINFQFADGYFSIQICVYLESIEEDECINDPYFELNDQAYSQAGGINKIIFYNNKIVLSFKKERMFLDKYDEVIINIKDGVNKKITDFFCNYLFLGEYISYVEGFYKKNIVCQTEKREFL